MSEPRPGQRKFGIELYRFAEIFDCIEIVGWGVTWAKTVSQSAQIGAVSLRIVCWFSCQRLLLTTGKLRLQRLSDSFGDLALDPEDVIQLPVVSVCPDVRIRLRVNQLNIDPHLIGRFLHAALNNVRYAKLLRDLGEIARFALIPLCRGA